MDRTALFKATVKTIRTKNKAQGVNESPRDILNANKRKSEFGTKAKEVVRWSAMKGSMSCQQNYSHVQCMWE